VAFSILLLATAWITTAVLVLTLARLIAARPPVSAVAPSPAARPSGDDDAVVALVPRGRNRLVPAGVFQRAA
jgi:hypothetical protein